MWVAPCSAHKNVLSHSVIGYFTCLKRNRVAVFHLLDAMCVVIWLFYHSCNNSGGVYRLLHFAPVRWLCALYNRRCALLDFAFMPFVGALYVPKTAFRPFVIIGRVGRLAIVTLDWFTQKTEVREILMRKSRTLNSVLNDTIIHRFTPTCTPITNVINCTG